MLYDEDGNPYVEPPLLPEDKHLEYIVKDYQRMFHKYKHLEQKVERMGETNTRISNLNYSQFRIIFEYAKALQHCIDVMQKHNIKLSPYIKNIIQPMLTNTFDIVKEKQNEIANDTFVKDITIEPFMYHKKEYVSEHKYVADILNQYVRENIKGATDAEKAMQDVLIKNGIRCEFQKPCLVFGKCYIMDFYLPDYGICIEVDGGYHDTQEQLIKDRERSNRLAKTGILVVRFTNEEAMQRVEVRRFIDNILRQPTANF